MAVTFKNIQKNGASPLGNALEFLLAKSANHDPPEDPKLAYVVSQFIYLDRLSAIGHHEIDGIPGQVKFRLTVHCVLARDGIPGQHLPDMHVEQVQTVAVNEVHEDAV